VARTYRKESSGKRKYQYKRPHLSLARFRLKYEYDLE